MTTVASELIERLQRSGGHDRKLDAALAVHPDTPSCGIVKGADIDTVLNAHDCNVVSLPCFTSSIDDAMALVPEGWGARASNRNTAEVWSPDGSAISATTVIPASGANGAVALCIAALIARNAS